MSSHKVMGCLFTLSLAWSAAVTPAAQPAQPLKDPAGATDPKVWINYDFVPGNRVIFFTDYADDQVGNFPKRLAFKSGNMEVAEVDGQRYLRVTSHSLLGIPLTAGNHQLRLSRNNFVAICLEVESHSSFTAGVRPSDYTTAGHARIYYQSQELPKGVLATADNALFFWASSDEEATRIRAAHGY